MKKKSLSVNHPQSPHSWRQLWRHFSRAQLCLGDDHIVNQYHTIALSSTLGIDLYLGICLANQVLLGFVDECVLLPFTLLERGGNGTITIFVNTDLEPAVAGLGSLTPGCDGAHGDKDPDSNPPFVIVAAGQVEVVLELELEEVRVENEDGAAEEVGRIEEDSAEEENNVLLGSSEVVDELWISVVEAAEVVGSTVLGMVLDSELRTKDDSEVMEAAEVVGSTILEVQMREETADELVGMFEEVSEIAEVLATPLDETTPLEDAIVEDATFEDDAIEDPTLEVVPGTSEDRGMLELAVAD
ncbi:uncharacterized protein EAE98_011924 [Botrytis deweyae]|uniref:Uncharacterized protein n=1 Tax=Botrytis deweyae TaxID=2478750 RepID=A0ABQ7I4I7_9HELO|nr:uncharacterized protein EAE98_011924 [Botrytis deweyae]KAF7911660.1 hypothetical protein EAE98_011924 [Botrytis deweyae]